MVFFISVVKIYGDTDGVIIFLLLFLYGLSIITLSFVFTPFFNQAKNAGFFGYMAIIILSLPNYIHLNVDTSVGVKWLTSLLSPVALGLGLTEVCALRHLINLYIIFTVLKYARLLLFLPWRCSLIYVLILLYKSYSNYFLMVFWWFQGEWKLINSLQIHSTSEAKFFHDPKGFFLVLWNDF